MTTSENRVRRNMPATMLTHPQARKQSLRTGQLPRSRFQIVSGFLPHVEDCVEHEAPAFHDIKQAVATLRPEEPAADSLRALHLRTGFGMLYDQSECGLLRLPQHTRDEIGVALECVKQLEINLQGDRARHQPSRPLQAP